MSTTTAVEIFNTFTGDLTDYALAIVPVALGFAVGIWGLTFLIRKGFGYIRGL